MIVAARTLELGIILCSTKEYYDVSMSISGSKTALMDEAFMYAQYVHRRKLNVWVALEAFERKCTNDRGQIKNIN